MADAARGDADLPETVLTYGGVGRVYTLATALVGVSMWSLLALFLAAVLATGPR